MFRHDPNTLWPTSLIDWLVILMFVGLLIAMFAGVQIIQPGHVLPTPHDPTPQISNY